jgi:hypothetical protein
MAKKRKKRTLDDLDQRILAKIAELRKLNEKKRAAEA